MPMATPEVVMGSSLLALFAFSDSTLVSFPITGLTLDESRTFEQIEPAAAVAQTLDRRPQPTHPPQRGDPERDLARDPGELGLADRGRDVFARHLLAALGDLADERLRQRVAELDGPRDLERRELLAAEREELLELGPIGGLRRLPLLGEHLLRDLECVECRG